MRILHVAYSCVPGEFRGGVPKAVFELARAQAALGHEVEVYATNYNSYERTALKEGDATNVDGVSIRYFAAKSPRWMNSPGMYRALHSEGGRYDVLHGHNTYLALNRYIAQAGRKHGVPTFYHSHGALDPVIVRRGWLKHLRKRVYLSAIEIPNLNSAAGVLALTEHERDQLRYWGIRAPIHVLANGVHIPGWVRETVLSPEPHPGGQAEKNIVFIGRLVPKKAIHLLVQAFAVVRRRVPEARLIIAGDRSQDPQYMNYVDGEVTKLGLESVVEFVGFLDELAKHRLLASARVFSHATESEGMALAILEAMASGLPTIVSTECYMGRAAEAGALVEVPLTAEGISEGIVGVLQNPDLAFRVGSAGARYVDDNHSWSSLARQLVKIYEGERTEGLVG